MIKHKYFSLSKFTANFFAVFLIVFASCSSAPKNTGDIITIRSNAERDLAAANQQAGHGNFEAALTILQGCKNMAVLTDDESLMIRCGLSLGNVLFTLGRNDEAFKEWEDAAALAENSGNGELLAISRIYQARGKFLAGISPAQSMLDDITREAASIKNDQLLIAFSWQARGLALSGLRKFIEAESAFKRALDIHLKERYLENASFDWYSIASARSLSGDTQGALQALNEAIALDRRTENSWGLAANWRAIGDVQRKAGNNKEAAEAYKRAKAIFTALKNEREAAEIDKLIELVSKF